MTSPTATAAAATDDEDLTLPVPAKMNICLMVVGTHGDINPFLGLADRLVGLGHRVRVATHLEHRKLVMEGSRHEYYPLGGNARQLSKWMVETGGTVLGEARNLRTVGKKSAMTKSIITSTWGACTEPSPYDMSDAPFEADAIIANPPVFGHVHVAEALGVPLHIFFPQPWYYATSAFPHPMLGLSFAAPTSDTQRHRNAQSYALFEAVVWSGFEFFVNKWRRTVLDLPVLYFGTRPMTLIPDSRIPFSAMWSPSFVPKPDDWPKQVRVVGTFTKEVVLDGRASMVHIDTKPFTGLLRWMAENEDDDDDDDDSSNSKPIFVGFGSMVIKEPEKLAAIIMKAAALADVRVVVQSSWSKMDVSSSSYCYSVGPCPHDWLLPQCSAVVHHGGAGTTAAGLRYGLPTLICPFFGDQHMWGAMVHRAGVGPPPCSVWDLTDSLLAEKFTTLKDKHLQETAQKMASQMKKENGIEGGLQHFLDDLPLDNMLCDVSLFLGKARMAKYATVISKVKVSVEIAAVYESFQTHPVSGSMTGLDYFKQWYKQVRGIFTQYNVKMERHSVTTYALGRVTNVWQGVISGFVGFLRHIGLVIIQPFYRPDAWARTHGMAGCLFGFLVSPFFMLYEIMRAFVVLFDRTLTGILNGCCGMTRLYTLDSIKRQQKVHEKGYVRSQVEALVARGFSEKYRQEVYRAGTFVRSAKKLFDKAKPFYPEDHWHFEVATVSSLLAAFNSNKTIIKLSKEEAEVLRKLLQERGDSLLSFSKWLLLLRKVFTSTGTQWQRVERAPGLDGSTRVLPEGLPEGEIYKTLFGGSQTEAEQEA